MKRLAWLYALWSRPLVVGPGYFRVPWLWAADHPQQLSGFSLCESAVHLCFGLLLRAPCASHAPRTSSRISGAVSFLRYNRHSGRNCTIAYPPWGVLCSRLIVGQAAPPFSELPSWSFYVVFCLCFCYEQTLRDYRGWIAGYSKNILLRMLLIVF